MISQHPQSTEHQGCQGPKVPESGHSSLSESGSQAAIWSKDVTHPQPQSVSGATGCKDADLKAGGRAPPLTGCAVLGRLFCLFDVQYPPLLKQADHSPSPCETQVIQLMTWLSPELLCNGTTWTYLISRCNWHCS